MRLAHAQTTHFQADFLEMPNSSPPQTAPCFSFQPHELAERAIPSRFRSPLQLRCPRLSPPHASPLQPQRGMQAISRFLLRAPHSTSLLPDTVPPDRATARTTPVSANIRKLLRVSLALLPARSHTPSIKSPESLANAHALPALPAIRLRLPFANPSLPRVPDSFETFPELPQLRSPSPSAIRASRNSPRVHPASRLHHPQSIHASCICSHRR